MRPPENPSDFAAHIAQENGTIKVYCVECERWSEVVVVATATVTYRQNHWPLRSTENAHQPIFCCGIRGCWADVGYLLNEIYKEMILEISGVPIPRQKRGISMQNLRPVVPKQMRMVL